MPFCVRKSVFCLVVASALAGCSAGKSGARPSSNGTIVSFEEYQAAHPVADAASLAGTCDKPCQDRRQEFEYVVYAGQQIYCYWDIATSETHTDYTALAKSLENQITNTISLTDYYLLLRTWASAFHDGHVNVMPKASDLTGLEIYTSPVRFEVLAPATDHEKLIVSAVDPKQVSGLAVGDEVVNVNGVPAHDTLTANAKVASSGSTERMIRYWTARRIADVMGVENGDQPFTITVKPIAGGLEATVQVPRAVELDLKAPDAPPADTGAEYYHAQVLPGNIGYFRMDAFEGTDDGFLIQQTMDRLANTNGLILDLRQNGGGDLSGDHVISRLIDHTVTRYKRSERIDDYMLAIEKGLFSLARDATGQFAQWRDLTIDPDKAHARYTKPVVALISPYCFSACDTFSAGLQGNGLATFVGEPTGGGTGTPEVFDLPISPFQFRYSTIRGQKPDGSPIEGIGTTPDVPIEPTAQDRATGKDTQLAKAIEVLQSKLGTGAIPAAPLRPGIVAPVGAQNLDRSPTEIENEMLVRLAPNDER